MIRSIKQYIRKIKDKLCQTDEWCETFEQVAVTITKIFIYAYLVDIYGNRIYLYDVSTFHFLLSTYLLSRYTWSYSKFNVYTYCYLILYIWSHRHLSGKMKRGVYKKYKSL